MSTESNLKSTLANVDDEVSFTSYLKLDKLKFNWIIKDFEFACKNMKFLESPRFSSSNSEKLKWYLRFEPTELKEGNLEKFNMILNNTGDVRKCILARISFSDFSEELWKLHTSYPCNYIPIIWSESGSDLYKKLLCNNSISKDVTLKCELDIFDSIKTVVKKPLTSYLPCEELSGQIDSFFDETFKDVTFTFTLEGKTFSAHKTILALRSPVFAAMFKSKINEEKTSLIEVNDIIATIFQKMLRFIYTDKVQDLKESAIELFYASENYQLKKLKTMCVNNLCENITSQTVLKILELADKFLISKLKAKCLEYISSHSKAVNDTEEFLELIKCLPHLAQEICKVMKTIDYENEDGEYSVESTAIEIRPIPKKTKKKN